MANFIADTKNKIQDLFVYLVSCGKSSKEPGNEQGLAIDVPGNAQDHGLVIIDISGNAEGQEPIVPISSEPENSKEEPGNEQGLAIDVPGNAQDHGLVIIDISGNAEGQEPIVPISSEPENSKEQEKENDEMFYGKTVKPDNKAYISTPPGKREAPSPKTG